MNRIADGDLIIFRGPIKDRSGQERIKKGCTINSAELKKIDWVVDGVEGPVPKS